MAAGSWDTSLNMMDIPHYPEISTLGFKFLSTVARSGDVTWTRATGKVKALARDAYGRDPMSKTTHRARALISTLQDTAHRTDSPGPERARATNLNGNILVYMAWCDLQGVSVNLTTPDEGRRYRLDRCRTRGQGWVVDC
jgi:hypothetical protein